MLLVQQDSLRSRPTSQALLQLPEQEQMLQGRQPEDLAEDEWTQIAMTLA